MRIRQKKICWGAVYQPLPGSERGREIDAEVGYASPVWTAVQSAYTHTYLAAQYPSGRERRRP